jgi:integrase/recombinase XerD
MFRFQLTSKTQYKTNFVGGIMENTATILQFKPMARTARQATKRVPIKNIDGVKYFTKKQIQLLRRTVRDQAKLAVEKNNTTSIREWMVIDLLTSTGIRVAEAADLRCGDINAGYGQSSVYVRNGKGRKSRTIEVPESLKRHLKRFLSWKITREEAIGYDDYVFQGQRGQWSAQAIQQVTKKFLKALGLYEPGKSVHALRHSYAVELYRKDRDLRAVQKQLGHASITTTQIYADITIEDLQSQIKGIWAT